jgi:hypothetical protein
MMQLPVPLVGEEKLFCAARPQSKKFTLSRGLGLFFNADENKQRSAIEDHIALN